MEPVHKVSVDVVGAGCAAAGLEHYTAVIEGEHVRVAVFDRITRCGGLDGGVARRGTELLDRAELLSNRLITHRFGVREEVEKVLDGEGCGT